MPMVRPMVSPRLGLTNANTNRYICNVRPMVSPRLGLTNANTNGET
jgi:hypothetical protein